MRPRLKQFTVARTGPVLHLVREPGRAFEFDDSSGVIEAALALMDGSRDVAAITAEIAADWPEVTEADVRDLVAALDGDGLIGNGALQPLLQPAEQRRYASNLAFFETFADLRTSADEFQERLRRAHVLQLGVGGLGSAVLPGLAGAGVGRITLLDCDRVELKNLTRQSLYTEADVGRPKLELAAARARAINSSVRISTIDRRVGGSDDIADLLDGVDLVLCGIDRPRQVSFWVNDACVRAGVPMIAGGMWVTRLVCWSVWPGVSGCVRCYEPDGEERAASAQTGPTTNRALGAVASLAGGLVGMEALRYLTGFAPPVSAGRLWALDLVTGACGVEDEWSPLPGCPVCADSPAHPAHPAGSQQPLVVVQP
jgi:molybdopterin/thiamine biosynthesis adenylyltransferase